MAAPFSRTARALALDAGRPALWLWGLAALGLGAWLAWFVLGRVTVVEVSRHARLEVVQAPHPLAPAQAGAVTVSHLAIGRPVRAGDVLVELDAGAARLQLGEEQARTRALAPRLAAARDEWAAQQAAVAAEQATATAGTQVAVARAREAVAAADFAADHARRLRSEASAGSVAEIEALRAEAEARRLAAARDATIAEARRQALDVHARAEQGRVQGEALRRQIVALEGDLATAAATHARLEQALERHQVRAPVSGVLAEVQPLRPGSYVAEGQTLATVVPDGELLVVAEFDPARALGRLQPEQIARLRLEGWPWAQYGSVPARVLRVAGEWRGQLVRVELQPLVAAGPALPLQHGQPGVVEVDVEQLAPVALALRAAGRALDGPSSAPPPLPAAATGPVAGASVRR